MREPDRRPDRHVNSGRSARKPWIVLAVAGFVMTSCSGAAEEQDLPDAAQDDDSVAVEEEPAADQEDDTDSEGTLAAVRERGELICGINDAVPGFGSIDEDGAPVGFDVDFCKVIAAAVLGDAEAVSYVPVAVADRFTVLQSGEIDVLSRNTTRTAAREGTEGGAFVTTTYYDGQGMMVRTDDGFSSIDDMEDTIVCVLEGTTTELNLATRFAGVNYEPLTFSNSDDLQDAFIADACDGWTSDLSQLASRRALFPDDAGGPDSLVIFDEVFSKEPLGPVVRHGDPEWLRTVDWAVIATIQAEEFGVSSGNVGDFDDSDDLDIRRFLGLPGADEEDPDVIFDPGLGLDTDMNRNIIEQVGNYGEIFDRHLGPDTVLGLERGVNELWTNGGLLYAPPYR